MEVTIQTYTVQPVLLPLTPADTPTLADPTAIDAAYSTSTQKLTVAMTFMIPGDLNPSQVAIKQYYDSSDPCNLQFYAVYGSSSTATPKPVTCSFKASAVDAAGHDIDLGAILTLFIMLVNTVGPKTSRGVMTTVRTTEQ